MPILPTSDYMPPLPFRSANLATIYPPLFRPTPESSPQRMLVDTPDHDILSLDRHAACTGRTRRLAIISHGLEGHARKKYVLGMARTVTQMGYDAVCWNQRGCGGKPNRLVRSYHSGETGDLHTIITHCLEEGDYDEVVLMGFSMGGNQILKYLGEDPDHVPTEVKAAVTYSVPCDLSGTERLLARPSRRVYLEYFMIGLKEKVRIKTELFPDQIRPGLLAGIRTLRDFDDRYTAPTSGFSDAADYYANASSLQFLSEIRVPTLLVNARNDPFLTPSCYPEEKAGANANLFLEMPKYGGHVGFVRSSRDNVYWSESRAAEFLGQLLG